MEYGFNIELAQKLGVNEAIMIRNFQFWLQKNKANEKNYFDGRYWTYNSLSAFGEIFPFWTLSQIRYTLKKLVDNGILVTGNYNKNPYDKTIWYSLNQELLNDNKKPEMLMPQENTTVTNASVKNVQSMSENSPIDMLNLAHRCEKTLKPIPVVNTDVNTFENTHTHGRVCEILSNSSEVDLFFEDYKALKNKNFEPSLDDKESVAKVLSKNGGYNFEKRQYWQDVLKKAARGWDIKERGESRIVPCDLDKMLAIHSKIKAKEAGLRPLPKVEQNDSQTAPEVIVEDEVLVNEAREKASDMVEQIKRTFYKMGQKENVCG